MRIAARVLDVEEAFAARAAALVDNHQRLVHELVLLHDALDHACHLVGTDNGTGRNDELDSLRRLRIGLGLASVAHRTDPPAREQAPPRNTTWVFQLYRNS